MASVSTLVCLCCLFACSTPRPLGITPIKRPLIRVLSKCVTSCSTREATVWIIYESSSLRPLTVCYLMCFYLYFRVRFAWGSIKIWLIKIACDKNYMKYTQTHAKREREFLHLNVPCCCLAPLTPRCPLWNGRCLNCQPNWLLSGCVVAWCVHFLLQQHAKNNLH